MAGKQNKNKTASFFLKEKADIFFQEAKDDIAKKIWFLAAFHFEQALQLYLKHSIYKKLGDYPKTHDLGELFVSLSRLFPRQKSKIGKICQDSASVIGDLNQAYITSRYLPVEFNRFQAEKMREFVAEIRKFLRKL